MTALARQAARARLGAVQDLLRRALLQPLRLPARRHPRAAGDLVSGLGRGAIARRRTLRP